MTQTDPSPGSGQPAAQHAPAPGVPAAPTQIVVKQNHVGRWFSWLGWMGFMLCIPIIVGMAASYHDYFDASNNVQEKYHSLSKTATDKIAIIEVAGPILDGDGYVKNQIDRAQTDPAVKGIVLRVNSPGGSVSASDYILHHLNELRTEKEVPFVVSMGSIAASGGYYVAMAVGDEEDVIFAEPTTTTGSIGVIIPHYDLSGLLHEFGIKDDSFVSHPRKQILSMTRPASEEDREVIQDYLVQAFNRFKSIVKSGRPEFHEHPERLDAVATGEIFSAERAQELGLVDQLGFVEDAIERVTEMASLDPANVRVVRYQRPVTLMGALGLARADTSSLGQSLVDLSIPKAYYLFTMLPGIRL